MTNFLASSYHFLADKVHREEEEEEEVQPQLTLKHNQHQ